MTQNLQQMRAALTKAADELDQARNLMLYQKTSNPYGGLTQADALLRSAAQRITLVRLALRNRKAIEKMRKRDAAYWEETA